MRSRLDHGLALGVILLVVALGLLARPAERDVEEDPRASSLISASRGARALYLTLEAVGVPVERRHLPWDARADFNGSLVLIAPSQPPSETEIEALLTWIEEGGVLVYFARPGDPMLDALGLEPLVSLYAEPKAPGTGPRDQAFPVRRAGEAGSEHRWFDGVDAVSGFGYALAWADDLAPEGAVPLLVTEAGHVVVAEWPLGEGRVIAWSDAAPLRNERLRESGAAFVLARTAAELAAIEGALVFDEFHHGFRGDGSAIRATLNFLTGTAAGHTVLQLLVVAGGLLILAGARFGRPYPPAEAARRSPLEHVDALAGLYRQAGARATARRLLIAQLARRLGRRPPPAEATDEAALERLTAALPGGAGRAAEVRAALGRDDLPGLARAIDQLVTEVRSK